MDKRKIIIILLTIVVYIISTGLSFAFFSGSVLSSKKTITSPLPSKTANGQTVVFDETLPKTEPCPLNGALYSKQQWEWWGQHRPLGIMIDNHEEARPQSGLSSADIIYEAVAEGAITRFLAVYYCQDAEYIGPIRSARTYFLDWISEYGDYPLYSHVGGANREGSANALGQIREYGWQGYNDLSQFRMGCPIYCQLLNRIGDGDIAIEHTMYSSTSKLWNFAKTKHKLANVDEDGNAWDKKFTPYSFKEDVSEKERPINQEISLEFWSGYKQYFVDWSYDRLKNVYKRKNGGVAHLDKNTGEQIVSKNIVVMYMRETALNDEEKHLLYKTIGTGKAVIFMDGQKITGTWRKDKRTSKTLLFDASGNPIKFNRGTIWFEILPTTGVVNVS